MGEVIVKEKTKERFFQCLKEGSLFISAPCGYGKTSVVRELLDEEECAYSYITCEGGNFEEKIKQYIQGIVVIDDFQLLKEQQAVFLRDLLEGMECHIVILSRSSLPAIFKAAFIQGKLRALDEQELLLGMMEIGRLLKGLGVDANPGQTLEILRDTGGHPLAVKSMAMYLQAKKLYSRQLAEEVKYDIFDYYDTRLYACCPKELKPFLLKIAGLRCITGQLATAVNNGAEAELLIREAWKAGYLLPVDKPDTYEITPAYFEYLKHKQQMLLDQETIKQVYTNAGSCYEAGGDVLKALECYNISGDHDKMQELLIDNFRRHPGTGHYYEMEKYYFALPEDVIRKSPQLMCGMSLLCAMCMQFDQSERWYEELKTCIGRLDKKSAAYKDAMSKKIFLDIGLPQWGVKHVLINLLRGVRFMSAYHMKLPELSVTSNLPSLMRGGKDFSSWSKKDRRLYDTVRVPVEKVLGRYGAGLGDIALSESLFEKGGTDSYELLTMLTRGLLAAETRGAPELCFVAKALIARIYIASGEIDAAVRMIDAFYQAMESRCETRLLPNIEALRIRISLIRGETYEADQWVREKAPDENERFYTMERYRYMVKIRCYIQAEHYMEALSLLGRLKDYTSRFHRTCDGIEVGILTAIVLFRSHDPSWQEILKEALETAQEYGFIRSFAEEGAAIHPLLEELDLGMIDTRFTERLLKAVRKQAIHYPRYLKAAARMREPLTKMEKNVLELIASGMKNEEIGDFLSISTNTVKFHIKNLYSKMQVKNRTQALRAAREYKLI
ncbi:LuxR C-terminal-related transcriptional regulator [Anaerovorax odorimutans]|uniref:LuxR C-terminal-related transcriptional regulator n=1 Tax=Anaerovorax odorimutans TaxID=109327 RepID=A0ABT1RJ48_9FIRM|nr:LuxR C-terminal-related transcriptional regulator [Anaerovorax odorimutans]MCQ4635207.1 LuxR C-terminal-related transcriptional regulator [Anaerovorax odorimutans]